MPKFKYKIFAKRRTPRKGLEKALRIAIYKAMSEWSRQAYLKIMATAPVSKTPSDRWPAGFVKSHIKLYTRRLRGGYSYDVVGVPGGTSVGSRAWRALVVIMALHYGWSKLPFTRAPTRKEALAFPVVQGAVVTRPGETKIVTKKAIQRKQIVRNPWITRAFESLESRFRSLLDGEIEKETSMKKKVKIA